eukprot:11169523-Lingulodinium_polyedra.AAC.1
MQATTSPARARARARARRSQTSAPCACPFACGVRGPLPRARARGVASRRAQRFAKLHIDMFKLRAQTRCPRAQLEHINVQLCETLRARAS